MSQTSTRAYNLGTEERLNTLHSQTALFDRQTSNEIIENTICLDKLLFSHSIEELAIKSDIKILFPHLVINPFGRFRKIWTLIISIALIYTSWIFPFRLAFEIDFSDNILQNWLYVDLSIDFIFLLDVGVNSFSAFENNDGILVFNKIDIFIEYLKFWFWVDLISSFPFYILTSGTTFAVSNKIIKLSKLPKLLRLLRFGKMLKMVKLPFLNKNYLKRITSKKIVFNLLRVAYWFFFLIHICACLWYYVIQFENSNDTYKSWVIRYNLIDSDMSEKYIAAMYYVVTIMVTVGYGNITATTYNEKVLTICAMLTGIFIYGQLMGALLKFYGEMHKEFQCYKDRVNFLESFTLNLHIPGFLHGRMLFANWNLNKITKRAHLMEKYTNDGFFGEISDIHLCEICQYMFKKELKKFDFFEDKPPLFIAKMVISMKIVNYKAGEKIYSAGDPAFYIYFILEGRVFAHFINREFSDMVWIGLEGCIFGEIDILFPAKRQNNVSAESETFLWRIESKKFMDILDEYPEISSSVFKNAEFKKNLKNIKNSQNLELQALMPMNYWKWVHEHSHNKINFDENLHSTQMKEEFDVYDHEYYYYKKPGVAWNYITAKLFLKEQKNLVETTEDEINFDACKKLSKDFFLNYWDLEINLSNLQPITTEVLTVKQTINSLKKSYREIEMILKEVKNINKNLKDLEEVINKY